jgi:CRISPR-associated protein Cmr6
MEYNIPIPEQSQLAFEEQKNRQYQNAGLIFERFAPDTQDASKVKEKGLQAVLNAFDKADKTLFQAWNTRWEKVIRAAGADPFTLKTDWRLIAGLGKKGSLEVGFTFHRYGFPYLPGSSLKGLARIYGLLEIALGVESIVKNKIEKTPLSKLDEILSLDDAKKYEEEIQTYQPNADTLQMVEAFRLVFGTTDTAGKVVFFDAIPSEFPKLELDIMNPHFPDYYKDMGNKEPTVYPTNWQSPIPIKFLTISPGSVFRFAIGWRNSPHDNEKNESKWNGWFKGEQIKKETDPNTPRLIKLARRWLQGSLLELGAGGKTNAGYGYFKD